MPASTTTSVRNTGSAAYAANGAASTRTFFTHCRGRIVRTSPRTSPPPARRACRPTSVSGVLSAVLLTLARLLARRPRSSAPHEPADHARRAPSRPARRTGSARRAPGATPASAAPRPARGCGRSARSRRRPRRSSTWRARTGTTASSACATSTSTDSSIGRCRRTTRLTAIDAACAATTPVAPTSQSLRRLRSTAAPTRPSANQPALCSPNSDSPRAARTTGGLPIARWIAGQRGDLDGPLGLGRRRAGLGGGCRRRARR